LFESIGQGSSRSLSQVEVAMAYDRTDSSPFGTRSAAKSAPASGKRPPSADDYKIDEDEMASMEQAAAADALDEALDKHIERIISFQREYPLDPQQMLSTKIADVKNIPDRVRQQVAGVQLMVRRTMELAAQRIEEHRYESIQEVLNHSDFGHNEKERAGRFVAAHQTFDLSHRTVRVTVELFKELNERVERKLENSVATGNRREERNLLLGNAVVVFELANFLINFIETHRLKGEEQFKAIHEEVEKRLGTIQERAQTVRKESENQHVSEAQRAAALRRAEAFEQGVEMVRGEWKRLWDEIDRAKGAAAAMANLLPSLRIQRTLAEAQMDMIVVGELIGIARELAGSMQSAVLTFHDIVLPPLHEERMKRLMGIVG